MKRNKIMALTALLTLLGAPSSKAQEVKGDSKQPTSAQSANKDSEAVDKTKEQNKNLDKTKDSKAPQQAKDSKTPQQKKEQTKDSNKNGKKDEKKQQTKDSNPSGAKSFVNRMMSLGYSMEWIKKNWPWLAAMSGTGVVSAVAGNKMGKKANVDAKVKQIVNADYMKKTDVDAGYMKNEDVAEKVKQEINEKIASKELVKAADVDAKVQQSIEEKVTEGELFKKFDDDVIKELANNLGIKYTDEDLANEEFLNVHNLLTKNKSNALIAAAGGSVINSKVSSGELFTKDDVQNNYTKNKDVDAKVQQLAGNKKYTEEELNKKVDEKTNILQENIKKLKSEFKYTEDKHKEGIVGALDQAYKLGTIREMENTNKKKEFDKNVLSVITTKDKRLAGSLDLIKKKLSQNFADILVKTTYGEYNDDTKKTSIEANQMVGAFVMLSDIKNALVNGIIGKDLTATIQNSSGKNDAAWSKFEFKINSKSYVVFLNHSNNEKFYVSNDDKKTEYLIPLK